MIRKSEICAIGFRRTLDPPASPFDYVALLILSSISSITLIIRKLMRLPLYAPTPAISSSFPPSKPNTSDQQYPGVQDHKGTAPVSPAAELGSLQALRRLFGVRDTSLRIAVQQLFSVWHCRRANSVHLLNMLANITQCRGGQFLQRASSQIR